MADEFGQKVEGLHEDGDTIVSTDRHVAVFGKKGTDYAYLEIDATSGALKVDIVDATGITVTIEQSAVTDGQVIASEKAMIIAGQDGSNYQFVLTDSSGALAIQDNGGTITVDAVNLDIRDIDNATDDILVYGWDGSSNQKIKTDASGNLQIDILATNFTYAEDTAHGTGDEGAFVLAVQKTSDGALAGDGDYAPLQVDSNGKLKIAGDIIAERNDSGHTYGTATCVKDTPNTVVTESPGSDTDYVGVMIAGPALAEWDIEFGTTASEAVIMKVWTTPASPTVYVPFPEKIIVSSTETILVTCTNRENAASTASDFTGAATLIKEA